MAVNIRGKFDRRRLEGPDKQFNTGRRETARRRAAARRGQAAYQYSRRPNTTKRYNNRNEFAPGIRTQQMRMQQISADKARQTQMRPLEKPLPSLAF